MIEYQLISIPQYPGHDALPMLVNMLFNAGLMDSPTTLAQHQTNFRSTCRVCWDHCHTGKDTISPFNLTWVKSASQPYPSIETALNQCNVPIVFKLFTTIHDGNFRRHSSMNVTIK